MKNWRFALGFAFIAFGLFQGLKYLLDYSKLSEFGKGYVWGSIFWLLLGIFTLSLAFRSKNKSK